MHARWARFTATRVAAVTVFAATVTAAGVVTTADATATATPVVIGSCATTVQGAPGTPVELSPAAVVSPIVSIIDAVPLLGQPLAAQFQTTFNALPPIPIGSLPTGSGVITGGQIANDVVAQLDKIPLLGPIIGAITGSVQSTLASMCQVTVDGVNAVATPVQQGAAGVDTASQQAQQQLGLAPKSGGTSGGGGTQQSGGGGGAGSNGGTSQSGGSGGSGPPQSNSPVIGGLPAGLSNGPLFAGGTLLDYGLAASPLSRYAGIPFAAPGLFDPSPGTQYGSSVPGYSASSGSLGQDGTGDVRTAGHAEALGAGTGPLGNGVGLPMLLAVLMLAAVTAALVRTWVLRKVQVS
jgi:uncharacterized membrane protein YgcG